MNQKKYHEFLDMKKNKVVKIAYGKLQSFFMNY